MRHVNTRQSEDPRPDRSICRHCGMLIEREIGDEAAAWTTAQTPALSPNPECPSAPSPDDGPMPGHEPNGIIIIHPPNDYRPWIERL